MVRQNQRHTMGKTQIQMGTKNANNSNKGKRNQNNLSINQTIRNNLYPHGRNRSRRRRTAQATPQEDRHRTRNCEHRRNKRTCLWNIQTQNTHRRNAQRILGYESRRLPIPTTIHNEPNMATSTKQTSRKPQTARTQKHSNEELTQLLRRTTILPTTRPNRSNATPQTQKTRNNDALPQSNRNQRRRRIHMQNSHHTARGNATNRSRLHPCRHNRRNTPIPQTQINQPHFSICNNRSSIMSRSHRARAPTRNNSKQRLARALSTFLSQTKSIE